MHKAVAELVRKRWVRSTHDVSDGGVLVAAAEMCIASGIGLGVEVMSGDALFEERSGRYLLEVDNKRVNDVLELFREQDVFAENLGPTWKQSRLTVKVAGKIEADIEIGELTKAWRGTLDW